MRFVMLPSHSMVSAQIQAALLLIQIPTDAPEKQVENVPSISVTTTHVRYLDGVPGIWLWSCPALAVVAVCRALTIR